MRRGAKIVPIILAAGPSTLEFPKALAKFGDLTAIEIALKNCEGLEPAIVVLGCDAERILSHLASSISGASRGSAFHVLVNENWPSGQMSSLKAALAQVPLGFDFLLYPVDYPLLTREVIAKLIAGFCARSPRQHIAVPKYKQSSGHPVIFAAALRHEFESAKTARDIVYRDARRVKSVSVSTNAVWRDLDSPAAYRACLREYERRVPKERRSIARHVSAAASNKIRASPAGTTQLLTEIRSGLPVTREVALHLITCDKNVLPDLLATAVHLKEQFKPGVITYSRKVFIPLTNLCRDYCGYCIFRRDPGQPGAHTMTAEEVLRVAREGERLGCREALFSLGDKPELIFPEMRETLRRLGHKSTLHYLEAMCELVLRETGLIPHANPGLMSAQWLRRLRAVSPSVGLMLEATSDKLMNLAAHRRAPDKVPALRLGVIEASGRQAIPFTTGILIGIGESPRDRIDSLFAIAELHRRHGHIQEVIVQNFRVKPGIPMSRRPEPSTGDMLRTVAVARLILGDMNLQAPPNLSSPDYHLLLSAGINDWGGISPLTPDFINPERPWPHLQELERRTRATGCELKQRLPVYPEFLPSVKQAGGLAWERTRMASDDDGYASPPPAPRRVATA